MIHIANFDGACEPINPGGTGGWGFVISDGSDPSREITTGFGVLPASSSMSNNVAEYTAALECLSRWVELALDGPLLLRGDSKLVIEQMSRRWRVKSGFYVPVHHQARILVEKHALDIRWEWIPREQNVRADELSKQGLAEIGVRPRRR